MATIKVPKTPKKAFNKNRRPSALLLNQIAHLEWAVLPASRRKPHQLPKQRVKTEAQAAERVGQLTTMLFAAKAAAAAGPASGPAALGPARLPPLPPVPKSSTPGRRQAEAKSVPKTRRTAGRQRTRRR